MVVYPDIELQTTKLVDGVGPTFLRSKWLLPLVVSLRSCPRMAQWMSAAAGERKVIFQSNDDRITTLTKTAEAATFERAISVIRRQSICESPAAGSNPESAAMHQVSVLPWSFFHRGLQVRQPSPATTTSCAVSLQ